MCLPYEVAPTTVNSQGDVTIHRDSIDEFVWYEYAYYSNADEAEKEADKAKEADDTSVISYICVCLNELYEPDPNDMMNCKLITPTAAPTGAPAPTVNPTAHSDGSMVLLSTANQLVPTVGLGMSLQVNESTVYTAVLATEPIADVAVIMQFNNHSLGLNPPSLIFTTDNWATPQLVQVTALDPVDYVLHLKGETETVTPRVAQQIASIVRTVMSGDASYLIIHTAKSADPRYNELDAGFSPADTIPTDVRFYADDIARIREEDPPYLYYYYDMEEGQTLAPSMAPTPAQTKGHKHDHSQFPTTTPTRQPTLGDEGFGLSIIWTAEPTPFPTNPTSEPTMVPTMSPTRVPTATPTILPPIPTNTPTAMPTFEACNAEDAAGANCDTDSSRCAVVRTIDGTKLRTFCECLGNFDPDPTDTTRCLRKATRAPSSRPTLAPSASPSSPPTLRPSKPPTSKPTAKPTKIPTLSPTIMPTFKPCTKDLGDFNNCDPTSSRCAVIEADDGSVSGTFCQCIEGFVSDPTDPYRCLMTEMPTQTPTLAPTGHPTGYPTAPTLAPTPTPTKPPTVKPTPAPTFPDRFAMCDLCSSHSCIDIQQNRKIHEKLTDNQAHHISWSNNTVADTLGACLFCEASSYNPDVCSFVQPEVRVNDWPVCDEMCAYSPCDNIADVISIHFKSYLGIDEEDLPMYVHRFVYPLCYACPQYVNISPDGSLQTIMSATGDITSVVLNPPVPVEMQNNISYACISNPDYNATLWGNAGTSSLAYQEAAAAGVSPICRVDIARPHTLMLLFSFYYDHTRSCYCFLYYRVAHPSEILWRRHKCPPQRRMARH
jgi:hypothetical protein